MKYVVIDLEMNTITKNSEARTICKNEIIEIGAVMLDENLEEVSSFKAYVKPEYNEITGKIQKLTGITNEMVVMAPKFSKALKQFTNWCLDSQDEITIYAWSESDYDQISKEMELKNYSISQVEEKLLQIKWSDFQHEFDSYLGFEKMLSLKQALDMAGIDFSGRQHDALDDARNTAELLQVFKNKDLFDRTLRKIKEAMEPKKVSCTLGDLFDFSAFA